MAFPLLPATLGLIAAGLAALNYFVPPEALPLAPDTEPIQPPFDAGFTGGQCIDLYNVTVVYSRFISNQPSNPNLTGEFTQVFTILGGIGKPEIFERDLNLPISKTIGGRFTSENGGRDHEFGTVGGVGIESTLELVSFSVARQDGFPDNCGDLPNPNPPYPIGGTGLANSSEPDLDGLAEPLTLGLVPVNLAALLAAALAAMQAAETIAALATALADAIRALKGLLDELKPENRDRNKSTFKFDFGAIEKDGYLKFYGTNNNPNFEAIYLDILFTEEPVGIGKYFGKFSPNRYIYDRLGYIAFVSPSLGVMEVKELEFYRCSLSVPKDCVGFFYHLGLNGSIKANVSAIYELKVEPVEGEE